MTGHGLKWTICTCGWLESMGVGELPEMEQNRFALVISYWGKRVTSEK